MFLSAGNAVMKGYLKNDRATAEAFHKVTAVTRLDRTVYVFLDSSGNGRYAVGSYGTYC